MKAVRCRAQIHYFGIATNGNYALAESVERMVRMKLPENMIFEKFLSHKESSLVRIVRCIVRFIKLSIQVFHFGQYK